MSATDLFTFDYVLNQFNILLDYFKFDLDLSNINIINYKSKYNSKNYKNEIYYKIPNHHLDDNDTYTFNNPLHNKRLFSVLENFITIYNLNGSWAPPNVFTSFDNLEYEKILWIPLINYLTNFCSSNNSVSVSII